MLVPAGLLKRFERMNAPVSHRTVRTTPHAREAFLSALSAGSSITAACRSANLGRTTAYDLRASDATFRQAWDDAIEAGTDHLEDEALRRACQGTAEPIISAGRQVLDGTGEPLTIRRYSDPLLTLLLKARRPDRYRDRISADLRADVTVKTDPAAAFATFAAILDGFAARKAAGVPTPELETLSAK